MISAMDCTSIRTRTPWSSKCGSATFGSNNRSAFRCSTKRFRFPEFVPDLIVDDSVVVDTKVIDRIGEVERGQMLNYLRITRLRVGLIINVKRPKLEWERIVF